MLDSILDMGAHVEWRLGRRACWGLRQSFHVSAGPKPWNSWIGCSMCHPVYGGDTHGVLRKDASGVGDKHVEDLRLALRNGSVVTSRCALFTHQRQWDVCGRLSGAVATVTFIFSVHFPLLLLQFWLITSNLEGIWHWYNSIFLFYPWCFLL